MKSRNNITAIIGILVCSLVSGDVLAQCTQRIEISNVATNQEKSQGSFDLKVVAQGIFNGQLVKVEGINEVELKSFSGSGEKSFSFAELDPDKEVFYRIIIAFSGEEKFLCKRRVKDIVITDTK